MRNANIGYVLAAAVLGGRLLAACAEALFARHCHHTGVDRSIWWSMGVVGWATLAAYWFLLIGAIAFANGANPAAWMTLSLGVGMALFVALRFRRYRRRR